MEQLSVGDRVQMRKKHPCGSFEWEIIRYGADVKIKCVKCEHVVMLQRPKFLKAMKKRIPKSE